MKEAGIAISIAGSIMALLFVPTAFLGMNTGWHFVLGDAGLGMKTYHFMNTVVLLLELIFINGIGGALIFLGSSS